MRTIRVGKVTKVDYKAGTVQVKYEDNGDVVDGLNVVCGFDEDTSMPGKGDQVLVLEMENRPEGFVLGRFWNGSGHKPSKAAKGDRTITIDGTLTVNAKKIVTNTSGTTTVNASGITTVTDKGTEEH